VKRKFTWSTLSLTVLFAVLLSFTQTTASHPSTPRPFVESAFLTPFATTFDVDRTDDTASASACTAAPNDCSLRGAIIAANADLNADPVTINLQPGTTYNLMLTNATQENS
jgi:hypothetical protein